MLQQFLYLHFAKAIPGTEWNDTLTTKPITITSIFGWIITFKVHFTFPKILVSWCWIGNKLAKDRGVLRKIRTTAGNEGIRIRALLKRMRPEGGKGICLGWCQRKSKGSRGWQSFSSFISRTTQAENKGKKVPERARDIYMWKNAELEYKEEVKYRSPQNKFTNATISHLSPSITNVKWPINLWQPHVLVTTKVVFFFAPHAT